MYVQRSCSFERKCLHAGYVWISMQSDALVMQRWKKMPACSSSYVFVENTYYMSVTESYLKLSVYKVVGR